MRNRLCVRMIALLTGVVVIGAIGGVAGAADTTTTTVPPGGWPKVDQPGVTDSEIRVSGVASTTNPLGGLYGTSFDGVQAYFDMINSQGGIYGRKLTMVKEHDDNLGNNQREVEAIIDQDNVFAVSPVATIISFTGAPLLEQNKIPTFGWGINDEWTGPPELLRVLRLLCNGAYCPGIILPWLANKLKKHRLGVLRCCPPNSGGLPRRHRRLVQEVREVGEGQDRLPDQELSFGVTDLSSDVKKMIDAKVDFMTTCMDSNGVLTLAKEMRQQGLNVLQYFPNGYDHDFMKKNSGFFQNAIVITQVAPLEDEERSSPLKNYVKWMGKAGAEEDRERGDRLGERGSVESPASRRPAPISPARRWSTRSNKETSFGAGGWSFLSTGPSSTPTGTTR